MIFQWNVFLGLDDVAYTTLKAAIQAYQAADPKPVFEDEEDVWQGVPVWAGRPFYKIYNQGYFEKVAKTPTIASKVWHLFSLYFEEGNTQAVKDWLDRLETEYPNRVVVAAAYNFKTGLLAGQSYDQDYNVVGTPVYPIHAQAHQFMPDECTDDDPPVCTPATTFHPFLVLAGQPVL